LFLLSYAGLSKISVHTVDQPDSKLVAKIPDTENPGKFYEVYEVTPKDDTPIDSSDNPGSVYEPVEVSHSLFSSSS
jgi:hypothetical protein